MKLFLTSSGLSTENEQQFLDLLGKSPNRLKAAFVITAHKDPEYGISTPELEKSLMQGEDYQGLVGLGFDVIFVDFEHLSEDTIVADLAPYDVIFVYGGNTFYLLYHARKSGFVKHAAEILENKLYVGISAGSIIVCPDISLAGWQPGGDRNNIGVESLAGMSLIDFCIMPHWEEGRPVHAEAEGYPYEIRYLMDGEAISAE